MTARPAHFQQTDDDLFSPTRYAQSHWGDDHLNGPAVVGLAARAMETQAGDPDFTPARCTVDLFKAARGVPTLTKVTVVRDGRRVRNSECEIVQDGVTVARAILTQYRRSEPPRGEEWSTSRSFDPPVDVDDTKYTYVFSDAVGWTSHSLAEHQNATRKCTYGRTIDVVAGSPNTPFVRAVVASESTSLVTNMGSAGVGYINGDLTLALARLPVDDWIGLQADAHWTSDGVAVGTATLFDSVGAFGSGLVTAISNSAAHIDFSNDRFPSRTPNA